MGEAVAKPTFREAFLYWLKLGFVNFGGPSGQIAMMHRDLVELNRWVSEERFLHALNFCMLLPGPEAQQLSIYLGWLMHRTWGGIVAGVLFVLPSVAVLLALSWVYVAYGSVPAVAGLLYGVKAVVLAIVVHALWRIGRRTLRGPAAFAIAAGAFVALWLLRVPFPLVIALAAVVGFVAMRPSSPPPAPTPPPDPRSTASRAVRIVALGALLWVLPMAALFALRGAAPVLFDQALFYTKAAFVTFGGAYAVLSYIGQQVVDVHGWVTAAQVVDGLGLAETTPGPLIMVVCFLGFVGGYQAATTLPPLAAGVLGGLVATYFTFLFGFLFIFLGAPHVERLRSNARLSAALAGITAAVVGVILNLALFFASHVVLTPVGIDWVSVAIGLAGLAALALFDLGVVPVVIGGALLGLVVRLVA